MENGVMERKTGKTRPKHSPTKIASNRIDCFLVSRQYQGSRGRIKDFVKRSERTQGARKDFFRESN
ncbi:hypothetical protein BS47DRAFT_1344336 [Hydnum rufescens UP504]|uniref:Uncharacterized protein n=1 Tax=Hydnum rufescens UP504 TaxID=1448309 RepID=A0A9P6DW27_9AGAM|nr:hypothetical protein BS47DRAFT_1344336 [Hydnum rufescens UP504]